MLARTEPWSWVPAVEQLQGCYLLRFHGVDAAMISILPDVVPLPTQHLDRIVEALNTPREL